MSGTNETATARPAMRRGLRILLFVSLALNLLVAGLVIGAVAHQAGGSRSHPPRVERPGGPMVAALTRADRIAIGKALREADRAGRPSRDELRAEYDAVIAALTTVPYEPETVRAAVERQTQGFSRRADLGRDLLLERLAEMSDEERAAFAMRLREVLERGPRDRNKKDGRRSLYD